jgi:multidrug transporter EmrE-like cation transporter
MKNYFLLLILSATAFEIIGDVFFKHWAQVDKNIFLWIGFVLYATGILFWAASLKYDLLSKAISVLTVLNLIIVVLVGALFFKERLSWIAILGIVLGIISVILLQF